MLFYICIKIDLSEIFIKLKTYLKLRIKILSKIP